MTINDTPFYERPGRRKERRFREEQEQRDEAIRITSTGVTDANAPSTFIPDLVQIDPQNKYEFETLHLLVREDPIARYIAEKIAANVYDGWFYLAIRGTKDEHPRNAELQKELERMNAKHYWTMALAAERTYGHCWVDHIPAEQSTDNRHDVADNIIQPLIARIDVYTPLYTKVTQWHDNGMPSGLDVSINLPDSNNRIVEIKTEDTVFMRTRPFGDRSYRGLSSLIPIFDTLNYIRQVLFSMGWYAIKIGIGVFYVKVKGALTTPKKVAAQAMLKGLSQKRGVIYSDLIIDEFGFIQAGAGSTDFPKYVEVLLGQCAVATGVPQSILTGQNQGQIGGSEVNSELWTAVINTEQQHQEFFLRESFEKMGFTDMDFEFIWNTRFAINEEQESKVLMNNTQADSVSMKSYMTINEVRARRGLPPVDGGDVLLSLPSLSTGPSIDDDIDVIADDDASDDIGTNESNNEDGDNL